MTARAPERKDDPPTTSERRRFRVGAELKSTFCVTRAREAFLSPHLGDLDSELSWRAFAIDLELYPAMLGLEPEVIAYDLHPEYLATKWALEQDVELADPVRDRTTRRATTTSRSATSACSSPR